MLGARACITLSHTPANCRGLGPAASPSHPTGKSGPARPYAGLRGQVNASDSGGRKSRGHPPPMPIAENLRPPRLDRRKTFLWEPPGDHVTRSGNQSPLTSARGRAFCPPGRPRLLRSAPPLFCRESAPAQCPARAHRRARSPRSAGAAWGVEESANLRRKKLGQRAGPEPPEPRLPATPQNGRGK